jgi:hypothetical protein
MRALLALLAFSFAAPALALDFVGTYSPPPGLLVGPLVITGVASADVAVTIPENTTMKAAGSSVEFRFNGGTVWFTNGSFQVGGGSGQVNSTRFFQGSLGSGTAPSGTGITVNETGRIPNLLHKMTVARTALTAAATTQDVTIWTIPAKTQVERIVVETTAGFDDGGSPVSAVALTCGKVAGQNEYLLSGSVFATGVLGDGQAELGTAIDTERGDIPSWSATTALTCRFTSTGGNLSTLTTGSATFWIYGITYP